MSMKWEVESVLEQSLSQIAAGKARVESCLLSYPAMAEELRPLLRTAERLRTLPKPELSPAAKARIEAQVLAAAAANPYLRPAGGRRAMGNRRPVIILPRWRWALTGLAALFVLLFLVTALVSVSGDALPGSPLYRVKQAGEAAQLWLAPSRGEPSLHLRFAARSLAGMESMAAQGTFDLALLEDLNAHMEAALSGAAELPPVLALPVLQELAELAGRQEQTLAAVLARVPEAPRPELERAMAASGALADRIGALMDEFRYSEPPGQTRTPEPPGQTRTPEPPGQTMTPQPPGQTRTPEPPGQTRTPEPPGQTRTPEPGQGKTPEPPGLTRTPEPPGLTRTPEPPGLTKTPEPPGQKKTPEPPGQKKTPEPPGQDKKPEPPGQDKKPKTDKEKGQTEPPQAGGASGSKEASEADQAGKGPSPKPAKP